MAYQVYIALTTEGITDLRFLQGLVERTFLEKSFDVCESDVEFTVSIMDVDKTGLSFVEYVEKAAKQALDIGGMTMAVHTDADRMTYLERRDNKIVPAEQRLSELSSEDYCILLTPIIPVRMTEAWMLANRELLRSEIGTELTNAQLGIDGDPEQMADPKNKIIEAIRRAKNSEAPKQRVIVDDISELYSILGNKIDICDLERLDSFCRFETEIINTLQKLKEEGFCH